MAHYGSIIKFKGHTKGRRKGARYTFILSTNSKKPEIFNIHKAEFWYKPITKGYYDFIAAILSHETIHQVIWKMGIDAVGYSGFDVIRRKFLKKLPSSINKHSLRI